MANISRQILAENFPVEVQKIFAIFLRDGDEIRLVGGCVRDMIFGVPVKDFDFATKFLPKKTLEILEKSNIHAVPTGIKFGTITAVINGKNFEITTLRKDNEHDGRHCEPEFIDDYFFDAKRRDFTINALYLDNKGLVYDYFNGISDLKNGIVRFIGDANERINEDFLRILRFFRFSCRYAKIVDIKGLEACVQNKKNLQFLSSDRIRNEIFRILEIDDNAKLIAVLSVILEHKIFSEISLPHMHIKYLQNILNLSQSLQIKLSWHLKFAALIFDRDLSLQEIFARFNFSNYEKKYYEFLFDKIFSSLKNLAAEDLRVLLVFADKKFVHDFYLLNLIYLDKVDLKFARENLNLIANFIMPNFPLKGDDIMAFGITGGRIGEILHRAKIIWAKGNFVASKEDLLRNLMQT